MTSPGEHLSGGGSTPSANVDPAEVARFGAMAERWWDTSGEFRPLHQLNPVRLAFARDAILQGLARPAARGLKPLAGFSVVDIGCGGGLVSEPLARMGARVTGLDLAAESIAAARAHADAMGLSIDYRASDVETVVAAGERFDAAVCLEVVEHVPDPGRFLQAAAAVLAPGGVLVTSTLNRTARAYLTAIVGAEYVLGWLPRGTHTWDRFLTPEELRGLVTAAGLETTQVSGLAYEPLSGRWSLSDDTSVNYMLAAVKR